jgi:rubrerythrin
MKTQDRQRRQIEDLLYQALETELGGVEVYRMALLCTDREALKEEWGRYLDETEQHVDIVRAVLTALELDAEATTPGRQIVRDKARGLVSAMQKALAYSPLAAELVAAEAVVDAETKDHANWQLLGALGQEATGMTKEALSEAFEKVAPEEDEHLNHSKGWCREMWRESMGLSATIPPPEETESSKKRGDKASQKAKRRKTVDPSAGDRAESRA